MQIITLEPYQFDTFANNHKYSNYYQTSSYGKTMAENGFNVHYIGIVEDNTLIGASLLVFKTVFMNQKIAYAPRGILFDYNDPNKVKELADKLKEVLGRQGFIILRMDPYIPATIRNEKGIVKNMNQDINNIMINIKKAGFTYKGQNKYFENELSRYEGIYLLNKNNKEILDSFKKRTRHKIYRAGSCGITVFKDENKNIDKLYELCKTKTDLPKKFIESLKNNFINIQVYYAMINTDAFVIDAKKRYEHELERNDHLSKMIQEQMNISKNVNQKLLNIKMESDKLTNVYKNDLVMATDLLKNYPQGLIVAGALTIEYNNSSYLIIDGFDNTYRHLNPSYLLKWFIIDDCNNRKLRYFNMNALVGEFKKQNPYKQLNEMKLGFSIIPIEYIGEFDLVLNNLNYMMYKGLSKDKNYKLKKDIH